MQQLSLIAPTLAWEDEILAYRQETLARDGHINGGSRLDQYERVSDWLAWLEQMSSAATCGAGLVPSTTLLCADRTARRVVGTVDIRHVLNDYLRRFGGHIGYAIRPAERGKGYGIVQLRLALDYAASRLGLARVLITCDRTNEASRRTILSCGGVLENEVWDEQDGTFTQRYWVETARPPERA